MGETRNPVDPIKDHASLESSTRDGSPAKTVSAADAARSPPTDQSAAAPYPAAAPAASVTPVVPVGGITSTPAPPEGPSPPEKVPNAAQAAEDRKNESTAIDGPLGPVDSQPSTEHTLKDGEMPQL